MSLVKKQKRNRYRPDKKRHRKAILFRIRMMFYLLVILSAIPLLSAAFAHSYHALLDAPWPSLQEIEIIGLNHLERSDILNTLNVLPRTNILTLKKAELADRLKSLEWMRSAIVRIDLSGRMVVEVTEREPLAIVHKGDFFLVDAEGKLFARAKVEHHTGLLLVTGLTGSDFVREDRLAPKTLNALRELLSALEGAQGWLPSHQISECRCHSEDGFVLYTTQGGLAVRLGSEDLERKLFRLQQILGLLVERQCLDAVTRIDLDYANRAYVEGRFSTPKGI